eukprot:4082646-Amphidinium_carterae.1
MSSNAEPRIVEMRPRWKMLPNRTVKSKEYEQDSLQERVQRQSVLTVRSSKHMVPCGLPSMCS